jgi:hypothetical protein
MLVAHIHQTKHSARLAECTFVLWRLNFSCEQKTAAFPQWRNCAVATWECRKIVRYVASCSIKCTRRVVRANDTLMQTRERGRKCQHAIPLLDHKLLFIAWKASQGQFKFTRHSLYACLKNANWRSYGYYFIKCMRHYLSNGILCVSIMLRYCIYYWNTHNATWKFSARKLDKYCNFM